MIIVENKILSTYGQWRHYDSYTYGVRPAVRFSRSCRTIIELSYYPYQANQVLQYQSGSLTPSIGPAPVTSGLPETGKMFGVNFADGRIKGYPGNWAKQFVRCVRGNPAYGQNDFQDNGDGTITNRATGLMWSQADSGRDMNWEAALAYAQARNSEKYLGYTDWRLPSAKELQSIVNYTRAPEATGSPAIGPSFKCSPITNKIGQTDYPYYWTGTTHVSNMGGTNAVYLAFGRAAGWVSGRPPIPDRPGGGPGRPLTVDGPGGGLGPPGPGQPGSTRAGSGHGVGPDPNGPGRSGSLATAAQFMDVHGAGAQRSDPKTGDPAAFPRGRGPQGDVVRINNFVRLVRVT